jgi:hypothetical protein
MIFKETIAASGFLIEKKRRGKMYTVKISWEDMSDPQLGGHI